jgi:hypothetical protein
MRKVIATICLLALTLLMNPVYATTYFPVDNLNTLTTSLVDYYNFQGNSHDIWGTNTGSDTTISYGTQYGKFKQGASFNGSGYITTPLLLGTTGDFSMSFWMNPQNTTAFNQTLFYNGSPSTNGAGVVINGNSTQGVISVLIGGVVWNNYAYTFSTSTWYSIILTKSGTSYNLYVNNVPANSFTATMATPTTQSAMGGGLTGVSNFTGYLDEVGFWSKALNAGDVTQLYNKGLSDPLGGTLRHVISS